MNSSRSPFLLIGATCAALVVAGIVVYRTAPPISSTFGWFAYSLPSEKLSTSRSALSAQRVTGLVMVVAGGIGASATVGYVLGLRNRDTSLRSSAR